MGEPSLEQRVGELEREVQALRARLDAAGLKPGPTVYVPAPRLEASHVQDTPAPQTSPVAREGLGESMERADFVVAAPAAEPEAPPTAPRAKVAALQELRADYGTYGIAPRRDEPTLERRIGGQVFAVAGALIVVIGLALAVKVAIDYGWFRLLPPGLRCVGIAGVGAAFLVVGELLRTRVRPIAVAGCNAAGVGGLYVAAYASYGVFHLVPAPVAFALMAGAAGVGLVVALRHGFLSTAVLSLIGAYLVPPFLSDAASGPYVLPVYLLLLSAVALSLAAWRPRPFGPVRDVAWAGTGLLGFFWTLAEAEHIAWFVVAFWLIAWAMHQAELLVTAASGQLWRGGEEYGVDQTGPSPSPEDQGSEQGVAPRPTAPGHWRASRQWRRGEGRRGGVRGSTWRRRVEPLFLAVATTAAVVAIVAVVLEHRTSAEPWLAPAAIFVATSLVALIFGGHLRVLRDRPRTDLEALAASHAAQSGALLIVAVALALGGWVEVTAWLAMGVGAVVAGRWTGARSLQLYGMVLLAVASGRLAVYDIAFGPASVPWAVSGGIAIAPWTVLVIAAGAAWMLVALLMLVAVRDEDGDVEVPARARLAGACAAVGAGAWLFAPCHPQSAAASVCLVWLAISLAYRGAARVRPALHMDVLGVLGAAGAIVPWIIAARPDEWLRDDAAPGMHPGLWLAGALVAVLALHAWASRRWSSWQEAGRAWPAIATFAAGVAFAATSIEIARSAALLAHDAAAQRAALSIWWGVWGVALVVGGFAGRAAWVRYVGLTLIGIAALKAVVLDLAGVPPLWRVASFVGLGGLMLGVAVLYGRVSASFQDAGGGGDPRRTA